jgi:hypothetical protein
VLRDLFRGKQVLELKLADIDCVSMESRVLGGAVAKELVLKRSGADYALAIVPLDHAKVKGENPPPPEFS